MAAGPRRESRTICLPIDEEEYKRIVVTPLAFQAWVERSIVEMSELLPEWICDGFEVKDRRRSKKQNLIIRRICMTNHGAFGYRLSC